MSPPLLGIEGEGQNSVSLVPPPDPAESGLKEHNYFGLSDCSSVDSSTITSPSEDTKGRLNLKATELRLGLPGSQSPERNAELDLLSAGKLDEKLLFPMVPLKDGISLSSQKNVVSGSKRGFCDTDEEFEEKNYTEGNWMFKTPSAPDSETPRSGGNMMLSSKASPNSGLKSLGAKEQLGQQSNALQQLPRGRKEMASAQITASNNNPSAPAAKAQVVGWPPIRSFRKNTLATNSKNNDEVDGKPGAGPLFVKVSMDGAPYLRKVDLRLYTTYQELSTALEKMFSCFTLGQCGSHMAPGRQTMNESKLRDILHGSEYVLTYEDKDGDWMLVGDVPWEMFIDSCKRLKIMKSTDAIGLAPRAMEKSKLRN